MAWERRQAKGNHFWDLRRLEKFWEVRNSLCGGKLSSLDSCFKHKCEFMIPFALLEVFLQQLEASWRQTLFFSLKWCGFRFIYYYYLLRRIKDWEEPSDGAKPFCFPLASATNRGWPFGLCGHGVVPHGDLWRQMPKSLTCYPISLSPIPAPPFEAVHGKAADSGQRIVPLSELPGATQENSKWHMSLCTSLWHWNMNMPWVLEVIQPLVSADGQH